MSELNVFKVRAKLKITLARLRNLPAITINFFVQKRKDQNMAIGRMDGE